MPKIKNGGLDQYSAEPFEQQQVGTAGVEGVNSDRFQIFQHFSNLFLLLQNRLRVFLLLVLTLASQVKFFAAPVKMYHCS